MERKQYQFLNHSLNTGCKKMFLQIPDGTDYYEVIIHLVSVNMKETHTHSVPCV